MTISQGDRVWYTIGQHRIPLVVLEVGVRLCCQFPMSHKIFVTPDEVEELENGMTFQEIIAVLREQGAEWFAVRDSWQVWVFRQVERKYEQRLLFKSYERWHVTDYWQAAGRLPPNTQDIGTIESIVEG